MGPSDKAKLDRHATSIRELEKQLLTMGSTTASCHGVTPTAKLENIAALVETVRGFR